MKTNNKEYMGTREEGKNRKRNLRKNEKTKSTRKMGNEARRKIKSQSSY